MCTVTLAELVRKHSLALMKQQEEKRAALRKALAVANEEINHG